MGKDIGTVSADINPFEKYMRSAGFGEDLSETTNLFQQVFTRKRLYKENI